MPEVRIQSSLKNACALSLLAAMLGGCGVARGAAELTDLATTPGEPKPFVAETRPQNPQYVPIGTTVSREAKRKTVDDFKKLEAELEAKRSSNEAAGVQAQQLGKTPPPKPAVLPSN